ncbi:MAG: hypothetical protein Q8924_12290 [Bacillota bacterium]|nr:hypothetical protein [Bacillota bacterium]
MIDHAKRIAENQRIDEMERHARPLLIVVVGFFVALTITSLLDAYAAHKNASQIQTADLFAQCLSGTFINSDDGIISCSFHNNDLVKGIK